jgi:hypothetical protein
MVCDFNNSLGIIQNPRLHIVTQAYNPSYFGGRDQEDHGSRPVQVKCSQDHISPEKVGHNGTYPSSQLCG